MADLQIVYLQDIVPVTRVEPVPDVTAPALSVFTLDAFAAATVLINGIESPLIVPINKSKLVAELPSSVIGDLVRSVAVLSHRATTTDAAVITFRIGGYSKRVSGIQRLVQRYALMMLTTPGSDIFHPDLGGGLQTLVGRAMSTDGRFNIMTAVQQVVSKTTADIQKVQSRSTGLSADERLVNATLLGVEFDPRTTTIAIRIQIDSAAGRSALANLFA